MFTTKIKTNYSVGEILLINEFCWFEHICREVLFLLNFPDSKRDFISFYSYPYSLKEIIITIENKSLCIEYGSYTEKEFYKKINLFLNLEFKQKLNKNSEVVVRVIPNSNGSFYFFTLYTFSFDFLN